MHLILIIALGVFGGLWLWSDTGRICLLLFAKLAGYAAVLAVAVGILFVLGINVLDRQTHHEASTTTLSDRDVAFLCRTGAAVPGRC